MRIAYHLIRAVNKLIYRHSFEKRYCLKASPWSSRQRTIPSRRLALIFVSVILSLSGLTAFLLTKHNSKTKAEAFSLELSPAPLNSNYLYLSANQPFKIYLGDRLQENKPKVRFEFDGSSADFSLNQIPNQNSQVEKQDNKSIIYKNVFSGIDIKYSLTEKGVKEEILINNQSSIINHQSFSFVLNLKNAVPRKSLEGKISAYFIDTQDGQYRFHIPKPFMVDAAGARSTEVELKIQRFSALDSAGVSESYKITLIPSQEWLNHPARQYPVIIDPSIVYDEPSEFSSGTFNRIKDIGMKNQAKLEVPYHELSTDINTFGLWHMNETANDTCAGGEDVCDTSSYGHHGTATGTTITTGGGQKLGAAARSFNGTSDYVDISGAYPEFKSDNLTIELWFKANSTAFAKHIIFAGQSTGNGWGGDQEMHLSIGKMLSGGTVYNNVINFELVDGSNYQDGYLGNDLFLETPFTDTSRFHHLAVVISGGTTGQMYLDGALVDSDISNAISKSSWNVAYIGKGGTNERYFNDIIDEVRVSNAARSPEEIKQDAQRSPYGIYTSDTIDLGASTITGLGTISWTDNITPPSAPSGWTKVKPVIIDNTQNSSILRSYQIKIQVDYNSDMQTDFDDLKFTNSSGTNLDYWIEEKADGAWATVWVEVDSITDNDLTTIFMWYGNSGASAGSNGANTFTFFDDFSSGTLSKWTTVSGTWSASNYYLEKTNTSAEWTRESIRANTSLGLSTPRAIHAKIRQSSLVTRGIANIVFRALISDLNSYNQYWTRVDFRNNAGYYGFHLYKDTHDSETKVTSSSFLPNQDQWYKTETKFTIDSNYVAGILNGDEKWSMSYDTTLTGVYWGMQAESYPMQFDDIFFRNFSAPEPVAGVGADIEFQTRSSANGSTWEAWKPTTNETAIASMDSDATNWSTSSTAMLTKTDESTIKMEGTGSLKSTVGAPQNDANTVGLWHFEETSGTGAYIQDETTNNNDGTPNGTIVADGFYGKARNFNGSSDYISVAQSSTLKTANVSVEAWVKADTWAGAGAYNVIAEMETDGTNKRWTLRSYNGDQLQFYVNVATVWYAAIKTGLPPTAQWHHVVGTYDGETVNLYLDGILVASNGSPSGGLSTTFNDGLYIGKFGTGGNSSRFFDGIIDEVRVSATTRTSEEIAEAYRAGRDHRLNRTISSTDLSGKTKVPFYFAGDKPGTIAETYIGETDHSVYGSDANTKGLWHLDDQSTNLNDESTNNYDGTSYNSLRTAYSMTASANSYAYIDLTGVSDYTIQSGDYLEYDIYWTASLDKIAFDYTTSDGAYLRGNATDQNGLNAHPDTNLDSYALGKWYHRKIALPSGHVGKVITYFDVTCENDTTSTRTGYFDGIAITNGAGTVRKVIYNAGSLSYANHLISSGSLTSLGDYAGPEHTIAQGKIGKARSFNGLSDYISMGDVLNFERTDSFSIEAWINLTDISDHRMIVTKMTTSRGYQFYVGKTGYAWADRLTFALMYNANTNYLHARGDIVVTDGRWHHVAVTYDGSSSTSGVKFYVDGKQDTTTSIYNSLSATTVTTAPFNIGARNSSVYFFKGTIDEVRVSNSVRTADETRLAYQYGLRTHQINVDFVTTPKVLQDEDMTTWALESIEGLYKGDMIIFREKTGTAEYIEQKEVININASNNVVTLASALSNNYAGGKAAVFKWQREYWDLNDISPNDRNATVRLGLRVLDASEGFVMYLDDFRHNTNYLTDQSGSTITSTVNRYIQYRAFLTTNNPLVTPQLTSVTITYDRAPLPSTSLLAEGQANPTGVTDTTPEFSAIYNDDSGDTANKYRIQVDNDSNFSSPLWDSGAAGISMTSCTQGTRCQDISYGGATTDLQYGQPYYWRIKYWDDGGGEGDWSTETAYFTMIFITSNSCHIDDSNQPSELTVKWIDNTTYETGYRIERNVDSGGFSFLANKSADTTSHLDNTTSADHTYQYRIRAESNNGNSDWCNTPVVNLATGNFRFEGVRMEGVKIE